MNDTSDAVQDRSGFYKSLFSKNYTVCDMSGVIVLILIFLCIHQFAKRRLCCWRVRSAPETPETSKDGVTAKTAVAAVKTISSITMTKSVLARELSGSSNSVTEIKTDREDEKHPVSVQIEHNKGKPKSVSPENIKSICCTSFTPQPSVVVYNQESEQCSLFTKPRVMTLKQLPESMRADVEKGLAPYEISLSQPDV